MEKHVIGKIVNTFGLKGELKVLAEKNLEVNFKNLDIFMIKGFDEEFIAEKISIKPNQFIKLKIKGYDDINDVLKFKNKDILIGNFKNVELENGEYLTEDLIGSKIYHNKDVIAEITEVENFGATDILVLNMSGKEARVPFVSTFFEIIDPKNKKLSITDHFFEGLVSE